MTQSRAPKPRSRLRLLLGRIAALGVGLVAVEVLLRVFGLPTDEVPSLGVDFASGTFTTDPELFWRLDERGTTYAVNAAGLRGWWPATDKLPDEYRIVCVGDSTPFGAGVRYEDTFGVRLERLAQAALQDRAVRTVLAALPGYSTHQSRVLLDRYAAALQPDVTFFYCGAWNDYAPAVDADDAEHARRLHAGSLRVLRLLERVFGTTLTPQKREALVTAFREGHPLHGRRVNLADFRGNVLRMIAVSRRAGSRVVVILPPLPPKTLAEYPIALEYRAVLGEVAAAENVPVVDAPAMVERFTAGCPDPWQHGLSGNPVCFSDWVHLSAVGHEILAAGLVAHLGVAPERAPAEPRARPTAAIESIAPGHVTAFSGAELVLRGRALDAPGVADRVWIGRHWIQHARVIDGSTLRLTLPRVMSPGEHAVTLCTPNGVVEAPVRLVVEPLQLDAGVQRGDAWIEVDVALTGPPGWAAAAWVSTKRRAEPAPTFAGAFHLHATSGGRPADRPDLPFRFDLLDIPRCLGAIDEAGSWRLRQRLPVPNFGDTTSIFVQAACWDGKTDAEGVLSEARELALR